MGINKNISGLKRDGPILAIAFKVLTRRLLRRFARYGHKPEHKWPRTQWPGLGHRVRGPYTQIPAPVSALWA